MTSGASPLRGPDPAFITALILSPLLFLLVFPGPAPAAKLPDHSRKNRGPVAGPSVFRHFYGRIESLDLSRHPMTLSAVMGMGRPLVFRFEGLLVPDTVVVSGGKAVGVKSLKKGQLLKIDYREEPKGGLIEKIFLLPEKAPATPKKTDSSPLGKKGSPDH